MANRDWADEEAKAIVAIVSRWLAYDKRPVGEAFKLWAQIADILRQARAEGRREGLEVAEREAQEIAKSAAEDIREAKEAEGAAFDMNCYGAGYDDGRRIGAEEITAAIRALAQQDALAKPEGE